jgi:hypothetical protein
MGFTPFQNTIWFKLRRARWAKCVVLVGEKTYKVFMGKSEGKRSLGVSMHKWEDNIDIDIKEIGWEGEE